MKITTIQYCLILPDGGKEVFELQQDLENIELIGNIPENKPEWAKLDFHSCPHCPLTENDYCPVAANLVNIVKRLDRLISYDKVHFQVITEDRTFSHETTAQRGIRSLMGFIIATSGCPHTVFFKPMARFHLPFANEEETIYRSASTYLLLQYFLKKEGHDADLELEGLKNIYHNMQIVNISLAERIRAASETDSTVNAVILLDMFAKALPFVIDDSLKEIRYLFTPYLTKDFINR